MIDEIRAFRTRLEDAAAERRVPSRSGTALFCDSARDVYDANLLRVERPGAAAEELAAEADAVQQSVHHRRITVDGAHAALTAGFARLGWHVGTHLVMALRRPPDRMVDTSGIREVPFEALLAARRLATLREPWGDRALADQLDTAKRRIVDAVRTRFFAAVVDGEIGAYCELRSDGRVAQIEDVNTLAEHRGRGLGRAVVQRAAEAAAAAEVVFVEALADDWPRELYARLGFDTIDERQLFTLGMSPLARIVVRTPRLELRLPTRAEVRELAAVARGGIHDPSVMPFGVPWTDRCGEPGFDDSFAAYHEAQQASWRPDAWRLELAVFHGGSPIGVQTLRADRFAEERVVATGSWLGRPWQGRGFGTEMRTAVLALAFEGLGAEAARSGAMIDNQASLGVSRKLGYAVVGTSTVAPRGAPVEHPDLELRREAFAPAVDVRIEGLERALPLFGAS